MNFTVKHKSGYSIVTSNVVKIDGTVYEELKNIFTEQAKDGNNSIIFDISKTSYCDSSGLSAIVVGNKLCKKAKRYFIICGVRDIVQRIFDISQIQSILTITPSLNDAIEYLSKKNRTTYSG